MTNFDDQFNLRKRHPLGRLHLLKNLVQSYFARASLDSNLDISYGNTPGQKIDIFPASRANAPVFVFVHGGYFRALDKNQYSYMAKPFVGSGCTVALVNYDLAPKVTVAEIVEQNVQAFNWLRNNIANWNGDPNNMVLCGHSVGAFLVTKIIENDLQTGGKSAITGAALLSGIYDLTKIKQSYLNNDLNLSDQDVSALSPIFGETRGFPPTLVAVGDEETDEFIKQSNQYSEKLELTGVCQRYMLLENKNHYTVSRLLSKTTNPLTISILQMFNNP